MYNYKAHGLTPRENVSSQSVGQSGKQVLTLPVLSLRGKKTSQRKSENNL